jgi:hypothetical protein
MFIFRLDSVAVTGIGESQQQKQGIILVQGIPEKASVALASPHTPYSVPDNPWQPYSGFRPWVSQV